MVPDARRRLTCAATTSSFVAALACRAATLHLAPLIVRTPPCLAAGAADRGVRRRAPPVPREHPRVVLGPGHALLVHCAQAAAQLQAHPAAAAGHRGGAELGLARALAWPASMPGLCSSSSSSCGAAVVQLLPRLADVLSVLLQEQGLLVWRPYSSAGGASHSASLPAPGGMAACPRLLAVRHAAYLHTVMQCSDAPGHAHIAACLSLAAGASADGSPCT